MKKALFFVISFLLLISQVFAFDVFDDNDNVRTYFSLLEDEFVVKTSSNFTGIEVGFDIGNSSTVVSTYPFSACGALFCAGGSLVDFLSVNNLTLASSEFTVEMGGDVETIYLDIDEPQFSLSNSIVDESVPELKLLFNYSDNYEVKNVAVYEVDSGVETFIVNLTGNSHTREISGIGSIDFVFKVYDVAGNVNEVSETIFVNDIFGPQILETFVTLDEDDYSFFFKVTDSSLATYEITQGGLKLSGAADGTTYENTVTLPFSGGSFVFTIFDTEGNTASVDVDLDSPLSVSFKNKYSDDKEFVFSSSANKCVLTGIGAAVYENTFDKDDDTFSVELDIDRTGEYNVKFNCENSAFRQFFTREFYFDENPPQKPNISVKALDNGYLELEWDDVDDSEDSDVEFSLFRDDDKIYSGKKTDYTDKKVTFPNQYEYYVEAEDEAGNEVDSDVVFGSPLKTVVTLIPDIQSGLTVESNLSRFNVETDVGSTLEILVTNANVLVYQQNQPVTQEKVTVSVPLSDGINEIGLKVTDQFGNVAEDKIVLNYAKPYEAPPSVSLVKEPATIEVEEPVVEVVEEDPLKNRINWIWWGLWIVIFIMFLWYFVFSENRLREKMALLSGKKPVKKDSMIEEIVKKRQKDRALAQNLKKIQKEREDRHFERLREQKREESRTKHPQSDFQKKKMDEISRPKKDIFEPKPREHRKAKPPERKGFFATLFSVFGGSHHDKKDDDMGEYIHKQRGARSWDSPNYYRQKYHEEKALAKERALRKAHEEKMAKEREKERERLEKEKEEKEKREKLNRRHGIEKRNDLHLDDYLNKKTKKRRLFFAEREVDKDIRSRK